MCTFSPCIWRILAGPYFSYSALCPPNACVPNSGRQTANARLWRQRRRRCRRYQSQRQMQRQRKGKFRRVESSRRRSSSSSSVDPTRRTRTVDKPAAGRRLEPVNSSSSAPLACCRCSRRRRRRCWKRSTQNPNERRLKCVRVCVLSAAAAAASSAPAHRLRQWSSHESRSLYGCFVHVPSTLARSLAYFRPAAASQLLSNYGNHHSLSLRAHLISIHTYIYTYIYIYISISIYIL